jgi:gamma-glutamylcyclotransferase (GGCT)/AIG2-like uncharacterized protein YtfP
VRVFAYGSLVAAGGPVATLPGHRRTWGVAMDNAQALPGYKRYRDRSDGAFPDVRVAFLDVVPDPAAAVDGVLLAGDAAALAALDARERNYVRVAVELADGEAAWCYVGSADGRTRARREPVVAQRAYVAAVRAAFAALGAGALGRYEASTDAPPPQLALVREELPEQPTILRDLGRERRGAR